MNNFWFRLCYLCVLSASLLVGVGVNAKVALIAYNGGLISFPALFFGVLYLVASFIILVLIIQSGFVNLIYGRLHESTKD